MDERNTRKNKLILYITIPLSILLIILNIIFIITNKNLTLKYNNIQENYINKEKDYNNYINEINVINQELNNIKELDSNIQLHKQEYFKTLKIFEDKVSNKEINYKIAYLTFDDGPYHLTHKFLEVLDQYDVRATFFTIGLDKERCYDNRSESCQELYKITADKGHTMANHTYSHQIFGGLYNSPDAFINEVKKQEQLIKEKTGNKTNIVRFPGGITASGNLRTNIIQRLREEGYGWVDWTASNGDGGYVPNKETALNNFKNTINQDIEVVLFHDYSYATLAALPEIIEYLQNNNYILLPLFYESKMINK